MSFKHHFIPIHTYFCPQLSSEWVQFFFGAAFGTPGRTWNFSRFCRGGFDVLAEQSQGARGGSWQKVLMEVSVFHLTLPHLPQFKESRLEIPVKITASLL